MGLTFAVGVGAVTSVLGLIAVALGMASWGDFRMVAKLSVVAFIVGVGFSGVLALAARGRTFEKLSLRFVTALGAGGGLLYYLFIAAANGARVWSIGNAIGNLVILTVLGGGSAAAALLLARRASRSLTAGDEPPSLPESPIETTLTRREAERNSRPPR